MWRALPPSAICIGLLVFGAATAPAQSVSERNGRIIFTGKNGVDKSITNGNLDSQPRLSFDKRQIVFVRRTPGQTAETGAGDVEKTELWLAYVDDSRPPKRLLTGGQFIEGPNANIVIASFAGPQFSPDGTRIYFAAIAYATQGAILELDLATEKTTFLFPGLGKEVITTGKYRGFLIGEKTPSLKTAAASWFTGSLTQTAKR